VVGYNIVACPCHNYGTLELHSIVENRATGAVYDITEDLFGEPEKWFVAIKPKRTSEHLPFNKLIAFGNCTCVPKHECKLAVNPYQTIKCPHISEIKNI
jgi:hypothetical protein